MQRLELSSIWALLAAFDDPLPVPVDSSGSPFEGAFVKEIDSISWMADNTKKISKAKDGGPYCWTFFSTAAFAKRNKVPQVILSLIILLIAFENLDNMFLISIVAYLDKQLIAEQSKHIFYIV